MVGWQEGMHKEQLSDQGRVPQEFWAMLRVDLFSPGTSLCPPGTAQTVQWISRALLEQG